MNEVALIRCNKRGPVVDLECALFCGEDAAQRAQDAEKEYRQSEPNWCYARVVDPAEVATLKRLLAPREDSGSPMSESEEAYQ